jgi:Peptidoglycan-synthase activator LpoB
MQLLAVLPVEPAPATSDDGTAAAPPPPEAGLSVTAQIYRVLADQTEFRFVPDLTVSDVVETPAVRRAGGLIERAVALGKEVGADGVIVGQVFRFQKRVGTEYGVSQPASVWFELALVAVSTGDVAWKGHFDQTQEPLSSNLLNWWMFWRGGPRWFSAGELAGLGVDRLFKDLTSSVNTAG